MTRRWTIIYHHAKWWDMSPWNVFLMMGEPEDDATGW